jgi:hypothetical protein
MKLKTTAFILMALILPPRNHAWCASTSGKTFISRQTLHKGPIKKIARVSLLEKNCIVEHVEEKQVCVQTTCLDSKKNSVGQSSCLKKVCKHIQKTKDITCLQWKKPQVENQGTKK